MLTTATRITKPSKDLHEMLKAFTPSAASTKDAQKVAQFADLLEQVFTLDPDRRMRVEEALKHPFIVENL